VVFEGFRSRLTLLFLHLSSYVTEELYIKLRTYTLLKYILVFCLACAHCCLPRLCFFRGLHLCCLLSFKILQKVHKRCEQYHKLSLQEPKQFQSHILYKNHAKKKTLKCNQKELKDSFTMPL